MRKMPVLFVIFAFVASACGSAPGSGPRGEVLAVVDGEPITKATLLKEVENLPPYVRPILCGQGAIQELAAEVSRGGGSRVVLVTSATLRAQTTLVDQVVAELAGHHLATFSEVGEHTPLSAVAQLEDLLEQTAADCVVSFGGGSVIDGVKAAVHRRG
ncbi:MAG: hypothetical protein B7Z74_01175, partial [Deltaproteobacteria bacterium 21-66-5]